MPIYEYVCDKCGETQTDLRPVDQRDRETPHFSEAKPNEKCGNFKRVMSTPASTFPGASKW